MPLHTPSPRRFLAPAPPSTQKSKTKPQSGLRHVASALTPKPAALHSRKTLEDDVNEPKRVTPAKRFVVPPPSSRKKSNIRERREARDQVEDAIPYPNATPRPKPKFSKVESIETTSPSSSANTDAYNSFNIMQRVEHSVMFEDESEVDEDEEDEILFVIEERNKRRRVSPDPPTSSKHARSDPPTPRQQSSPQMASPITHRFKISESRPVVFDNMSTPAPDRKMISRPHFILPQHSLSPTKAGVPLPETFSPSRKNGKYVPNGMASTLQSWIHETASTGYSANNNPAVMWGREQDDGVKIRVTITDVMSGRASDDSVVNCWPGGVVFIRGTTDTSLYNASRTSSSALERTQKNHAEIKIILAGQGGTRAKSGVRVKRGSNVGVRAPIWDVEIGTGEQVDTWLVGVEWVLL